MTDEQMMEFARHIQIRGIFSTASFVIGLILLIVLWIYVIRTVKRSDWDSHDRALALFLGTGAAIIFAMCFVWGICAYGPDIFAPKGEIVQQVPNHQIIKINMTK